ncbi:MAG TPA: aminotransferase class I/II-fold pyridoxal phosphate-dependent enzyme [Dongiaceae bacterium]|nr:aminotransferase class I/II-fold pyridoxal phosphate-dependent enzyme [Dongiaceae bacterium]
MTAPLPRGRYLRDLPEYPFARLDAKRREMESKGMRVIDLGIGDPSEPTPQFIQDVLADAVPRSSGYPRVLGIPELRNAAAAWLKRRFGVDVDPDREILPVNGSKEAIHSLPLALIDAVRPLVLVPVPAYPVYALGANAAGGEVIRLPLHADNGYLPDLDTVPDETWAKAAMLWINYPHNPTGATASRAFLDKAASRCREHGVLLASDEAYADIYFEERPPGALEYGTENVLAFHTLSKRSAMAGYRTGFMAGDPRLIAELLRMRPGLGVATPRFVQEAAVAAWNDDVHASEQRQIYAERKDRAIWALIQAGYEVTPPQGGLFLWMRVPAGFTSESFAMRCLEAGVVLLPGSALDPSGEGFVRISLTAPTQVLDEALARLTKL